MYKYLLAFLAIWGLCVSCGKNQQPKGPINRVEFNIEPVDIKPKDSKTLEA